MARLLPITAVGSLSHQNIESAIEFSMKFDIPFLPELPHLDGTMDELSKNSCLELFLKKSNELKLRKIQYPSPEINIINITDYKDCITFIDAPVIIEVGNLTEVIKGRALHSCSKINIEQILKLKPTHLSFDCRFIQDPQDFLSTLVKNNIIPVVGIISTHSNNFSRANNSSLWIKALRDYSSICWLSPACGLANFNPSQSEEIYQELISIRSEILQSH